MSKIIKKKDLDLVIESTLIENGIITEKEAKPDYIDLDGDGDKEESMKKAAKDKEEMKEEEMCEGEGCMESDVVEESVKELAEAVSKDTNINLLKEDVDKFKKLINHRI
jgi:hypothetical protein